MGDADNHRRSSVNSASRVCFSFAAYAKNVIDHLRRCQVPIARGLTDEEFGRIEATFGFAFPPDLRSILREGLPVGVGFPNWRSGATQQLRMMMDLPMAGLSYEVSKGRFWWKDWGSQPYSSDEALRVAKTFFSKAPIMVPIYSHCYIPCSPNLAGNPVFFIYQKDIYYCGYDVADFFEREAFVPHNFKPPADPETESEEIASVSELIKEVDRKKQKFAISDNGMEEKWEEFKKNPEKWGKRSLPKICTKKKEIPGRKSVSEDRVIERPEPLIKSAGNSPRNGQAIISRYRYFHEKPLSTNVLNRFTIQAPPWVAKAARKIDFWSDLVEKKQVLNIAPPEGLFSSVKVFIQLIWHGMELTWHEMELIEDHRLGVIGLQCQPHPAEIAIGELNNSVVKRIGMPYTILQTVFEFIHGPWPAHPVDIGPFPSGFIRLIPVIQMHALFVHRPQGSHGLVGFHNMMALTDL